LLQLPGWNENKVELDPPFNDPTSVQNIPIIYPILVKSLSTYLLCDKKELTRRDFQRPSLMFYISIGTEGLKKIQVKLIWLGFSCQSALQCPILPILNFPLILLFNLLPNFLCFKL
jgi:hypothetical protein